MLIYIFHPNVEVSFVLIATLFIFELFDAFFQDGLQVPLLSTSWERLLDPGDIAIPWIKRIGARITTELGFKLPKTGAKLVRLACNITDICN